MEPNDLQKESAEEKQWISYIHSRQYAMLMNGDIKSLRDEISSNPNFILSNLVWQPDYNTALHIAAITGQVSLAVVILSLEKLLLSRPNSDGDLPIHVAVRAGHLFLVQKLVQLGDGDGDVHQLESENHDKDTPLHIALENKHAESANFLFRKCPLSFYRLNAQGISPLYLAIKAQFWELVRSMLDAGVQTPHLVENTLRHTSSSVLHAAIQAKCLEMVANMMSKYPDLLYSYDEYGRTPLSYAAHTGFLDGVRYFLTHFPQEAFELNRDGSFPIHNACSGGNVEVVHEFLTRSCNTKCLLNKRGQNILHIAAGTGKAALVKYLLGHNGIDRLTINMKDKDGNTPLHLAVMGMHSRIVCLFSCSDRVVLMLHNKQGFTALDYTQGSSLTEAINRLALRNVNSLQPPQNLDEQDIATTNVLVSEHKAMLPPLKSDTETATPNSIKSNYTDGNTLLVVSTLIATVTFAATFSLPGGYSSSNKVVEPGLTTMARRLAIQVFLFSNTIAFCCSIVVIVALIWAICGDHKLYLRFLNFALPSLAIAHFMTFVAFITGLFVVLLDLYDWYIIVGLLVGCAFLPLLLLFLHVFFPMSSFSNKLMRYISRGILSFMLLACDLRSNGKYTH